MLQNVMAPGLTLKVVSKPRSFDKCVTLLETAVFSVACAMKKCVESSMYPTVVAMMLAFTCEIFESRVGAPHEQYEMRR